MWNQAPLPVQSLFIFYTIIYQYKILFCIFCNDFLFAHTDILKMTCFCAKDHFLSRYSKQQIGNVLTSWWDLMYSASTTSPTWISCWDVTRAVGLLLWTLVIGQVRSTHPSNSNIYHHPSQLIFNFTLISCKLCQLLNMPQAANLLIRLILYRFTISRTAKVLKYSNLLKNYFYMYFYQCWFPWNDLPCRDY